MDGLYPFDFLFMSLKISDWNADHFFGGGDGTKKPSRGGLGGESYAASLDIHLSLFAKGKTWLISLNKRDSCCI